ncbi:MAG: sulfotransferase [Terriglobales bacterium]
MLIANKPNFFIVGAPKSGTTALYSYLADHPDIGMSKRKEPHFFASDIRGHQRPATTLAQYLRNFEGATGKRRIGEASTAYLASRKAPQEILAFNPCAQIIVMVRNPLEVMHAMHSQRRFNGGEHITRFELAVDSLERRYWHSGPFRGEPVLELSYRETTRFSEQLRRYFDVFGRERVHVIVFDDFSSATGIDYDKVLSFLGLRSDGRRSFQVVNDNKRVRSQTVQGWLRNQNATHPWMQRSFPSLYRGVKAISARVNYAHEPRPAMEAGFRRRLEIEYASEIANLGRLLNRNLDHWLVSSNPGTLNLHGAATEFCFSTRTEAPLGS